MHPDQEQFNDRFDTWLDRWLGNAPDWVVICVGLPFLFAWALCHYKKVKRWYYLGAMERLTGVDKETT